MRTSIGKLAVTLAVAAAACGMANAQPIGDRPLEGIGQAVVMPPEVGGNPANEECGVTSTLVIDAVVGPTVQSGLRTERFEIAQPFTVSTPGVYLIPTVATLREGRYMCVSWVSLRAQSAQPITVPSTGLNKTVQVLHWDRGYLLSTNVSQHAQAVSNAFQRLAGEFGQQWRDDQR